METNVSPQVQGPRKVVDFSPISISRVYPSNFKEGFLTAELKQTVTEKSYYPTKSVSNDMKDNIFETEDFGMEEKEFISTQVRVDWIDVPAGSTPESVLAQLTKFPEARIMRVLSNRPILNANQKYALTQPNLDLTVDKIADSQVVRYPADHEDEALRNKVILDPKGKVQYKANFFRKTTVDDEDRRTVAAEDFYITPNIKAELEAMKGVQVQGAHVAQNDGLIPNAK